MEGQWNCTSNPNYANEHCVVSTQNWYVYTLLKGVLSLRAMNFCVGESMPLGAGQCLLSWGVHVSWIRGSGLLSWVVHVFWIRGSGLPSWGVLRMILLILVP